MRSLLFVLLLAGVATAAPVYPDPTLTPGAAIGVAMERLCTPGYTASVRNVSRELKRLVFLRYGVDWTKRSLYEVDHFVPLELSGAN
ncbi:MAG: HNH endonuclease, partial [Rhodospirillaceae bacterium]